MEHTPVDRTKHLLGRSAPLPFKTSDKRLKKNQTKRSWQSPLSTLLPTVCRRRGSDTAQRHVRTGTERVNMLRFFPRFSHRPAGGGEEKRIAHVDARFSSILFTFFSFPKTHRSSRRRIRGKKTRHGSEVFRFFFVYVSFLLRRFVPPPFSPNGGTHDRRRTYAKKRGVAKTNVDESR